MDKQIQVYVLDMVEEFECMGGDCPYTCCKGWQVCIDEDTLKLYRGNHGLEGIISYGVCKSNNGTTVLRKICGRCPFHTFKGLCGLQLRGKKDYMPLVCRMYPRCSFVYGDRQEVTLELSCYRAAQRFVENAMNTDVEHMAEWLEFKPSEKEYPVEWELNDPDSGFIDFLLGIREDINHFLYEEEGNVTPKIKCILEYTHKLHSLVSQDKIDKAREVRIEETVGDSNYALFPVRLMNEHIYGVLEDSKISFREPLLYKIIKKYRKLFGKLWEYEADDFLNSRVAEMLEKNPDIERLIFAYFGYNINQSLMVAAEDYYLLKPVVMSAVMTQFLIIFVLTDYLSGEVLDNDRLAAVISNMEKGIAHNPFIMDTILKSVNELWFEGA